MKKNYLSIIAGTVFLFGFLLYGKIALAQNKPKEDLRTRQAGTLLGAILNLFHKKEAVPERIITGRIESEGFSTMPYVRSLNSGYAALVDDNGTFTINVPLEEKTLVVGAPGLLEQTFELDEETAHYDILLRVTGDSRVAKEGPAIYGVPINRRSFNGAYTTLTAQDIRTRNSATLDEVLVGSVPGLTATGKWNGVATNFRFTIRGRGSLLSSNAPLVVLDGAPYSGALNTINPNDVQYLTVLRDAAGKAAFGSRGANGIILITTKRGEDSYIE